MGEWKTGRRRKRFLWLVLQVESLVVLRGSPVVLRGSPVVLRGSPVVLRGSPVVLRGSPVVLWGSPVWQSRCGQRLKRHEDVLYHCLLFKFESYPTYCI